MLDSRIALTAALSLLPNFYLIIPCKVKQLPVSEYPEAWQLIVQAFLQMKWEFKAPNGWKRNELLAPSLCTCGATGRKRLSQCSEEPDLPLARQQHCTDAGPKGLLPVTPAPCPARAPPEERQLCRELTVGNHGGNMFVEKQHCVLGGVGRNPAGRDGWGAS